MSMLLIVRLNKIFIVKNEVSNKFVARLLECCGESMKIDKHPSPVVSFIKLTTLLLFITSCFYSQKLFASLLHSEHKYYCSSIHELHIDVQNSDGAQWPLLNIEGVCLTENQNESDTDDFNDLKQSECIVITDTVRNDVSSTRTKAHHISTLAQNQPTVYLYVLFHAWKSFIS